MKVVLISTSTFPSDQGIRTVSSILKNAGHKVKIVFMAYSEDYSRFYHLNELTQLLRICREADLIGISSYASTAPRAIQILNFLKGTILPSQLFGGVCMRQSLQKIASGMLILCALGKGKGQFWT